MRDACVPRHEIGGVAEFVAIEAIIAAGGTFCTLNYLIRRDYCARRDLLVRPPHKEGEILPALRVYDGLVARHRTVIQHVAAAKPTECNGVCTDTATDGGKAGTVNVDVQVGNANGPGLVRPWGWRRW